ncbi:hypothetical protein OCK74_12030 [Chitinophagaceae bacterium LB-8]|uniref:Uncharacterized protein n=1 Tax=Paraflavisolibacter caeni TaxID=2982496 RepID=A0A9X2XVW1_9BACT|nr:hypothetical protein [Paraflavisolibacter caeni]MCU7549850.1 hypothetical protein [Paraflavisolibacter caeni]
MPNTNDPIHAIIDNLTPEQARSLYSELKVAQRVAQGTSDHIIQSLEERSKYISSVIDGNNSTASEINAIRDEGINDVNIATALSGAKILKGAADTFMGSASLVSGPLGEAYNKVYSTATSIMEAHQNIMDGQVGSGVAGLTKSAGEFGESDQFKQLKILGAAASWSDVHDKNDVYGQIRSSLEAAGSVASVFNEGAGNIAGAFVQGADGMHTMQEGVETVKEALDWQLEQKESINSQAEHAQQMIEAANERLNVIRNDVDSLKEKMLIGRNPETDNVLKLMEQRFPEISNDIDEDHIISKAQEYRNILPQYISPSDKDPVQTDLQEYNLQQEMPIDTPEHFEPLGSFNELIPTLPPSGSEQDLEDDSSQDTSLNTLLQPESDLAENVPPVNVQEPGFNDWENETSLGNSDQAQAWEQENSGSGSQDFSSITEYATGTSYSPDLVSPEEELPGSEEIPDLPQEFSASGPETGYQENIEDSTAFPSYSPGVDLYPGTITADPGFENQASGTDGTSITEYQPSEEENMDDTPLESGGFTSSSEELLESSAYPSLEDNTSNYDFNTETAGELSEGSYNPEDSANESNTTWGVNIQPDNSFDGTGPETTYDGTGHSDEYDGTGSSTTYDGTAPESTYDGTGPETTYDGLGYSEYSEPEASDGSEYSTGSESYGADTYSAPEESSSETYSAPEESSGYETNVPEYDAGSIDSSSNSGGYEFTDTGSSYESTDSFSSSDSEGTSGEAI